MEKETETVTKSCLTNGLPQGLNSLTGLQLVKLVVIQWLIDQGLEVHSFTKGRMPSFANVEQAAPLQDDDSYKVFFKSKNPRIRPRRLELDFDDSRPMENHIMITLKVPVGSDSHASFPYVTFVPKYDLNTYPPIEKYKDFLKASCCLVFLKNIIQPFKAGDDAIVPEIEMGGALTAENMW